MYKKEHQTFKIFKNLNGPYFFLKNLKMNNLIVKKILYEKGIPEEIEWEIIQYLPLPKQVKLKKEMIIKLNLCYDDYWNPGCWTPRKSRPPRLRTYKIWNSEQPQYVSDTRKRSPYITSYQSNG